MRPRHPRRSLAAGGCTDHSSAASRSQAVPWSGRLAALSAVPGSSTSLAAACLNQQDRFVTTCAWRCKDCGASPMQSTHTSHAAHHAAATHTLAHTGFRQAAGTLFRRSGKPPYDHMLAHSYKQTCPLFQDRENKKMQPGRSSRPLPKKKRGMSKEVWVKCPATCTCTGAQCTCTTTSTTQPPLTSYFTPATST
jgi:hypothetical protein